LRSSSRFVSVEFIRSIVFSPHSPDETSILSAFGGPALKFNGLRGNK